MSEKIEKTLFQQLVELNVNEHKEKKGQLDYLSWTWAVSEFKKACPNGRFKVVKDKANNRNYFSDGKTCWVETKVWTDYKDPTCKADHMWLPVMDYKNKSIPLNDVTSSDVNKNLMRCLVKNIAVSTGLGLYIYAGEDLPEDPNETAEKSSEKSNKSAKAVENYKAGQNNELVDKAMIKLIEELNKKANTDPQVFMDKYLASKGLKSLEEVNKLDGQQLINSLTKRINDNANKG